MNKRFLLVSFILIMSILTWGCASKKKDDVNNGESNDNSVLTKENIGKLKKGKHNVEIKIIDYGTIKVELDADKAPVTVTNFINLVEDKFYDGLTFHRIIKNFMIQGGDPEGNGLGGSDRSIQGEFKSNGVKNNLSHTRGAISMARTNDKDSASSQFFIVQKDTLTLDGEYAVFGYVTEGIEVVDKICEKVKTYDDNGSVLAENQPTIKSIRVID